MIFVLWFYVFFEGVVLVCVLCPCEHVLSLFSLILASCFAVSRLILVFLLLICQIVMFLSLTPFCACLASCSWAWLCWICLPVWLNSGFSCEPHVLWICLYKQRQLLLMLLTPGLPSKQQHVNSFMCALTVFTAGSLNRLCNLLSIMHKSFQP